MQSRPTSPRRTAPHLAERGILNLNTSSLPKDVSRIINDLINMVREGLRDLPAEARDGIARFVMAYATMKLAPTLVRVLGANARRTIAESLIESLRHDPGIQLSVEEVLNTVVGKRMVARRLSGDAKDRVLALLRSIDDLARFASSVVRRVVKSTVVQAPPNYAFIFTFRGERTYAAVRVGDEWFAERVRLVRVGGDVQAVSLRTLVPLGISGDLDGEVIYDPRRMARLYVLRIGKETYRAPSPEELALAYKEEHPGANKELLSAFLAGFFGHIRRTKGEARGW